MYKLPQKNRTYLVPHFYPYTIKIFNVFQKYYVKLKNQLIKIKHSSNINDSKEKVKNFSLVLAGLSCGGGILNPYDIR